MHHTGRKRGIFPSWTGEMWNSIHIKRREPLPYATCRRFGTALANSTVAPSHMRLSTRCLLACLATLPLGLHAEVLHIDGIIRVKEGSWKGVKLTVVPEFSEPFAVDLHSSRFDLMLPLHATYLLRAEHAGCPTKEVLFDCTVPSAFGQTAFEFPIQIDLAVEATLFEYAGPVGLVTFEEGSADFTYTTDYSRIKQVRPLPDLHQRMPASALGGGGGADPMAAAFASLLAQASTGGGGLSAVEPIPVALPAVTNVRVVKEAPLMASITNVALDLPVPHNEPLVATVLPSTSAPLARPTPVAVRTVVKPPMAELPERHDRPCGTHDIEAHAHYVIKIDRVPTPDGCSELRKVVHAYGGIFFFHDGRAVTEPFYQHALTAQH